jgi:Sporulation and spore germination
MIPRNLAITIALLLVALLLMGLYGWHLRRQALELQQRRSTDTRPITPPISGSTEDVTLYTPDDEHGTLVRRNLQAALPEESTLRAREIVRLLITGWQSNNSKHVIGPDADVKEVFLLNNNHTAVVDVNSSFAQQHRSGILIEELTLASLARTLGANVNGLSEMKLIVDGHEKETLAGHADLTDLYDTNTDWRTQ